MKIILCTQGSQGVVALREIFSQGFTVEDIEVFRCYKNSDDPLIPFLKFNKMRSYFVKSSKDFEYKIKNLKFKRAILLSISWKFKFSKKTISQFRNYAINLHPGLLPKYKGCFSTSWSLINNEKFVGYTYHIISEKFDSGNILLKKKIKINKYDHAFSLNYKIMQEALSKIGQILSIAGSKGTPQNNDIGTYYKNILPNSGEIKKNWKKSKKNNFIRATYCPPFDPAFEKVNGSKIFYHPKKSKF
jgi:methionyl-tRNA formyltransferase